MTESIAPLLQISGLDASLHVETPQAWQQVWAELAYQGVAYSAPMLAYQHAYFCGAGWTLHDISLVLRTDGRPCGLWPLSLGGPPGERRLTSAGAPVLAPAFIAGLSPRTIKKICSRALDLIKLLMTEHGCPPPQLEQAAWPGMGTAGASEWHQQLMATGATATVRHDLFTDLRPALADIRGSFRKSFRPLINVGLRNWQVQAMNHANADPVHWLEFKHLHRDVAGRSTRSDATWDLQFQSLCKAEAFLIALRDPVDQRLVGAGYFQHSRDEGLYSVGAYDRALFDRPLGHVVQQMAIEALKALGVAWYRIGERHYVQDLPRPTDKQIAISAFKQGFASHVFCRHEFQWPMEEHSTADGETQ